MKLEVFTPDFKRLDVVNSFSMVKYTDMYSDVGSFEIRCPINEKNLNLFFGGKDRILWLEDEAAGVIQYYNKDAEDNSKELTIKGNLLSTMLDWRYIYPQINLTDKPDAIMRHMVRANCIDNIDRSLPYLTVRDDNYVLDAISYQQTGSYVRDECTALGGSHNLGYEVAFLPKTSTFEFRVLKGSDRTVGNTQGNKPVAFTTELQNILKSDYTINREGYRNTALIAGEGEGSDRVRVSIEDPEHSGFFRREIYVDARDLQSVPADTEQPSLTPEEYQEVLNQRGLQKLQECVEIENFSATLRNDSNSMFVYGRDYRKGDLVTVIDRELGISLSATVTAVEITYDRKGYVVEPTFGYGQPTLLQKLKRKGVL